MSAKFQGASARALPKDASRFIVFTRRRAGKSPKRAPPRGYLAPQQIPKGSDWA